jgi:hypothetical protein
MCTFRRVVCNISWIFRTNLVVCDILLLVCVDLWFVIYICFLLTWKSKKKFKVASPSALAAALGEEDVFP